MNIFTKGFCIALGAIMLKGDANPSPLLYRLRAELADRDLKEKSVHDLHSARQRMEFGRYIAYKLTEQKDTLKRLNNCPKGELLPKMPLGYKTNEHQFSSQERDLIKRISAVIDPEYVQYLNYLDYQDLDDLISKENDWKMPITKIAELAEEKLDDKMDTYDNMYFTAYELKEDGAHQEGKELESFWKKFTTFWNLMLSCEANIKTSFANSQKRAELDIGTNKHLTDINMQVVNILLKRSKIAFKDLKEFYNGLAPYSAFKIKLDAIFAAGDSFSAILEQTENFLEDNKMFDPAKYDAGESNDGTKVVGEKAIVWIERNFNPAGGPRTKISKAIAWATDAFDSNRGLVSGDWAVYRLMIENTY